MDVDPQYVIREIADLSGVYGPARERSLRKQIDHLDEYCRAFIRASPLVIVSTGSGGLGDASPRGDLPGFVKVADDHALLIPDRRGNNRLDSLKNLIHNPAIGLLFLVPGIHETFRVNGEAVISRDPALTAQFPMQGTLPSAVVIVKVKEAYIQCSRALLRADLWNPAKHPAPGAVPSMGAIMAAHTCGFVDAQQFDEEARTRVPATLY
jgi:uncharacterized protein